MKTISRLPAQLRALPCDRYVSPCPVYVHPAVYKLGAIPGIWKIEKRTGLKAMTKPGTTYAQLVRA